jgi:hypothetical protein
VPFVRTPTNIFKVGAEYSPGAIAMKDFWADMRAGGARRDLAVAKATVGSGFMWWMADLAEQGVITGSPPADDSKARLFYADGKQPYSVKVGDTYYSYGRLDPFAITIGTAADIATQKDTMSERQLENASGILLGSIIKNMGSKTWLSGLSDFFSMTDDPEQNLGDYSRKMAASFLVPSLVSQAATSIDPVSRDTRTLGDVVQSRLPGMSSSLPARRDIWGEPIQTDRLGPDYLSPSTMSTAKNDPVNTEMTRLGASAGMPSKQHKVGGKNVDYTPREYDRLSELAGRAAHTSLSKLIADPAWQGRSDAERLSAIRSEITAARKAAKAEMFGPGKTGLIGSSSRTALAKAPRKAPPPPAGFVVEGEAGGRNVYADLLKIPGITPEHLTSGFPTREYQQDMKRRGYHPADNSGHLDGSSFDIVVPRGKSMDWLAKQLRGVDPNVRLLPEGDHMHTTWPGYYGAPALGGARAAKLKNPNAGMPPPPPGFKVN